MADDENPKIEHALDLATKNAEAIDKLTASQIETSATLNTLVTTVDKLDGTLAKFIQRSSNNESWRAQLPVIGVMVAIAGLLITLGSLVLNPVREDISELKEDGLGHRQEELTAVSQRSELNEAIGNLMTVVTTNTQDIDGIHKRINENGWSSADQIRNEKILNERLRLLERLFQQQIDQLAETVREYKDDLDQYREHRHVGQ